MYPTTSTTSSMEDTTTQTTSKSTLGKDDFLKLLTEQLQNQDPLNPMSGSDFAAQLAQFSTVEQLTNMNTLLTESVSATAILNQSINNSLSTTYIGKVVRSASTQLTYDGTDQVGIGYTLPQQANSVTVQILNSSGDVVKTIDSKKLTVGDNTIEWDGTDDQGNTLGAGTYTFKVSAYDSNGTDLGATPYTTGTVTGVKFTSSGTMLIVNGQSIKLSDVQEILGS